MQAAQIVSHDLYYAYGESFNMLTTVCVVVPLVLAASRAWGARRGRMELGLIRHPFRREHRPHLTQALNIWLCCGVLGRSLRTAPSGSWRAPVTTFTLTLKMPQPRPSGAC